MEPTQKDEHIPFQSFYHLAKASIMQGLGSANSQLTATADLPAFGRIMVAEVRKLTGFDSHSERLRQRVLLYKFDADGHGEVIAEDKVAEMDSYLGLHFPESDIPQIEDDGNITGYLGTLTDITEKKRLEQQFFRAQRLE